MSVLDELRSFTAGLPRRAPPIPYLISGVGQVGHLHQRGVYLNSAYVRHVNSLHREEERIERVAREVSKGRFSAEAILAVLRQGSDSRDAIRAIKSARALLKSWDDIAVAYRDGRSWQTHRITANGSGAASNVWTCLNRRTGGTGGGFDVTGQFTYSAWGSNAPGGSQGNATKTGAPPLPASFTDPAHTLYLSGFSALSASAGIFMVVDTLVAAGGLVFNVTTTQNVSTTSLPRYSGGDGVMMTLEVETAGTGATTQLTINYNNQAGAARTTVLGSPSPSGANNANGLLFPPTSPYARFGNEQDYGVQSVADVTLSVADATAGSWAVVLVKPLAMIYVSPIDTANPVITNYAEKPPGLPGMDLVSIVPAGSGYSPYLGTYVKGALNTAANPLMTLMDLAWG